MNEKKLKTSMRLLEEYKKVVDAGSIVSKTDLHGRITYANEQFCKISGYTQDELIGKNHNIVRHPDIPSDVYKNVWSTIQKKEVWRGNIKNRAKDGSAYYVSVTIVPILDEHDDIVEYIALRQDITELKELKIFLEERVKEEVEKNRVKDEQSIAILTAFLDQSPNPIIVYDGSVVQYVNHKFLSLINQEKSEFIGTHFPLESLFSDKAGCIRTLAEFDPDKEINKVSISLATGRNIFNLFSSDIVYPNNQFAQMYTFVNITLIEYQKLKISSYNEQLEDFIKNCQRSRYQSADVIDEGLKDEIIECTKTSEISSKAKRVLTSKEKDVLKKSRHNAAISSEEYQRDLDSYIFEKIDELSEIEAEIDEQMSSFREENNVTFLKNIAEHLSSYASTVFLLIEFEDLSYAIQSLAELLQNINSDDVDDTKYKKVELYLSNIVLDLSNWRRTVFIEQSTNDIHYLDSSLFSTILQFELIFNTADVIEDEDDFELF